MDSIKNIHHNLPKICSYKDHPRWQSKCLLYKTTITQTVVEKFPEFTIYHEHKIKYIWHHTSSWANNNNQNNMKHMKEKKSKTRETCDWMLVSCELHT